MFSVTYYYQALELYEPPVLSNALSRCRVYARRGAAFFQREQYVEGDFKDLSPHFMFCFFFVFFFNDNLV